MAVVASVRSIGGGAVSIGNAAQSWSSRRGLLVTVTDGSLTGNGETSPLEGTSTETLEAVRAELDANLGRSIDEVLGDALSSSARFALETAALDLAAQQGQTSIAALLAGIEPVAVRASALLGDPRSPRALDQEIVCAKLKVGPASAWRAQAMAIDALVSAHPAIILRLDFNSTLALGEARTILAEARDRRWPIDYIEDPISIELIGELDCSLDIALDASLSDGGGLEQALALASEGRAQVAVLKPTLLGGLRKTFEIAARLAPSLDLVVSHLLDGPLAASACAELACAIATLGRPPRAAGVGPHAAFAAYGANTFPQLDNGWLRPQLGGLKISQ